MLVDHQHVFFGEMSGCSSLFLIVLLVLFIFSRVKNFNSTKTQMYRENVLYVFINLFIIIEG